MFKKSIKLMMLGAAAGLVLTAAMPVTGLAQRIQFYNEDMSAYTNGANPAWHWSADGEGKKVGWFVGYSAGGSIGQSVYDFDSTVGNAVIEDAPIVPQGKALTVAPDKSFGNIYYRIDTIANTTKLIALNDSLTGPASYYMQWTMYVPAVTEGVDFTYNENHPRMTVALHSTNSSNSSRYEAGAEYIKDSDGNIICKPVFFDRGNGQWINGSAIQPGNYYNFLLKLDAVNSPDATNPDKVSFKVWKYGASEPAAYSISYDFVPAAGYENLIVFEPKHYGVWNNAKHSFSGFQMNGYDGEDITNAADVFAAAQAWNPVFPTYAETAEELNSALAAAAEPSNGVSVTYRLNSKSTDCLSISNGTFTLKPPSSSQENRQYALEATFTKGNAVTTKSYPITVIKTPDIGDEYIYDNESAEFTTSGADWTTGEYGYAYNGTFVSDGSMDDDLLQTASWSPYINKHGYYEVYLYWYAADNRPDKARVIVENFNGKDTSHTVNQKEQGGWHLVDTFEFKEGVNTVSIQANSKGYTAADALKIKLVSTDNLTQPTPAPVLKNYTGASCFNIVKDDSGNFHLTENGEIFDIHGICYDSNTSYEELSTAKEAGANIVRFYGAEDLYNGALDVCYELGLKAMVQVWVNGSGSGGFDYNNKNMYNGYVNYWKKVINDFKDHPALALWCVNNEAEDTDVNGEVYETIEELTRYIKEVDPYHPVATAFAGCYYPPQEKLKLLAPSVDILGCNVYKYIGDMSNNTQISGWVKPTLVTEFGPNGTWETYSQTSWGALIEPGGAEKADLYRTRYTDYVKTNRNGIGSFAFCFENAVGSIGTESWYAFMFDGMKTTVLHEMQYAWTGQYADNVAPRINSFTVNGKTADSSLIVSPGETMTVAMSAADRDNDTLTYHADIREEINTAVTSKTPRVCTAAVNSANGSISINAPDVPGWYRIYAYVTDGNNNVCVDNFPIYVKQQ